MSLNVLTKEIKSPQIITNTAPIKQLSQETQIASKVLLKQASKITPPLSSTRNLQNIPTDDQKAGEPITAFIIFIVVFLILALFGLNCRIM